MIWNLKKSVAEAGVRDDAAPMLADEGSMDKACGVIRPDAKVTMLATRNPRYAKKAKK
jgi:hypothetical protein